MSTDNPFEYWEEALKGNYIDQSRYIRTLFPEGNASENPQPGYYRRKAPRPGVPDQAIAFWVDDDNTLQCLINNEPPTIRGERLEGDALDLFMADKVWSFCQRSPIEYEVYELVAEHGKEWPDDAGLGHNLPTKDADFIELQDQINSALVVAGKITTIEDKNAADRAANVRDRLNQLKKAADAQRREKKKPHDDAGKAVQNIYRPLLEKLDEAAGQIRRALTPYLKALEAEKIKQAAKQPEEAAPADLTARVGGAHGRRTSLKTVKSHLIENYALALEHVKGDAEVIEGVSKAIRRRVRSGEADIPGVKITIERQAT